MIYAIVGGQISMRDKALQGTKSFGNITHYIYSEQIYELEPLIDASSLFGDPVVVMCYQVHAQAQSLEAKELFESLLPKLQASKNTFIIDEPTGDQHLITLLKKHTQAVHDVREKSVQDKSVFALCDAFAVRDKKLAWSLFMKFRETDNGEAVAGALWWKMKTIWNDVLLGKKTKFTKDECERYGSKLIRSTIIAHRGEGDLFIELEKIILSL